jgi:zinc transporter ZupT
VVSSSFLVTAVAILSAACGVWLTSIRSIARRMVSFSGGVLMGVAMVWVLPEVARMFGWTGALAWTGLGFALLGIVDRFVYPVCPACSHTHEHDHCSTRLHGFAAPLLAAAAVHSALDGWSLAAVGNSAGFGSAFALSVAFHKIPEGVALGSIARAALPSKASAIGWCALAQTATILGASLEAWVAPNMSPVGLNILLAIASGSFLYLGGHAIHGELRRNGAMPALMPALTGVAGSGVLRLFIR